MSQPKTKPVPVRFDENTKQRIKKASRSLGSNSAAVIRLGVLHILPQIEAGIIRVPKN